MQRGAPLVKSVPGRAGWELRLVVQGGLRIAEKIRQIDHATLQQRPKLKSKDGLLLVWRALLM
jgi:phytoene/squalene synthetase